MVRTGDTAVLEGSPPYWRILGRTSVDIIKSGGYKISAPAIEDVLLSHDNIRECAVVGIPDETMGELIAAVIAWEGDQVSHPAYLTISPDLLTARSELRRADLAPLLPAAAGLAGHPGMGCAKAASIPDTQAAEERGEHSQERYGQDQQEAAEERFVWMKAHALLCQWHGGVTGGVSDTTVLLSQYH